MMRTTHERFRQGRYAWLGLVAVVALAGSGVRAEEGKVGNDVVDAVVWERRLVCVEGSGRCRVWDVETWRADDAAGVGLSRAGLWRVACDGETLWVGTGYGEWGGHLLGLDVRSGKWVQYVDDLHYVTGITEVPGVGLGVSWAMSHFDADTVMRAHGADAQIVKNGTKLPGMYYQRAAYSTFDQAMYAMEREELVEVQKGRPVAVATIGGALFKREAMAVGVAPGVVKLIPMGRRVVVVVTAAGPVVAEGARVTRLAGAGGTTGTAATRATTRVGE